jgi:hypothetical protein
MYTLSEGNRGGIEFLLFLRSGAADGGARTEASEAAYEVVHRREAGRSVRRVG